MHKNREAGHHDTNSPRFAVVLSDTDNDLASVQYALNVVGVCDKQGAWRTGIRDIRVIHTGDWLNKWNPSAEIVDYFMELSHTAPPSCDLLILNGNHELRILQRAEKGEHPHLGEKRLAFIRSRDLLHVYGKTLFLHGYPTCYLLKFLQQIKNEKKGLNRFNERIRKAFYEGSHALFRKEEGQVLMGNIKKAQHYYREPCQDGEIRGIKISELLKTIGIRTVVHGHRPNIKVQQDNEFNLETPGIRLVNNDNQPKTSLLGAAIVDIKGDVTFVNSREMIWQGGEKKFKNKIRKFLGIET
ncbi:MAG: metallophosphoesterase [Magnetococcales bacterium]|nr:metallophosphoesterase [Magnetococcales bacterium]MBF0438572.1 metallophosphoesterase [Magnetococcales bacterium]